MKLTTSVIMSLLATAAMARPRNMGQGDPLPQKSRVTAFIVGDNGDPTVECWEIFSISGSAQVQRTDGSYATSYALSLAGSNELDGIDILTWPYASPIWPDPHDTVHSEQFDLENTFNLFSVQGGLINFNFYAARFGFGIEGDEGDEVETHIFSMENGDDWFYFEDDMDSDSLGRAAHAKPYPFSISTISATETELMRVRYKSQPKHTVVHKGACSFTGIKTPSDSASDAARTSRVHSPLTVQVNVNDAI